IWHMQYLQDVLRPSGGKWTGEPKKYRPRPEWAEAESFRLLEPNVRTPLRAPYTADRPFAPSPRLPEPYETFADTFSYGI
ncbi:MAG: hypothetical protein IKD79_01635, partial [Oscillospiraceae bacterium]|nr:hypothetical protein [Oscillospiraceae bacterium]